MVFVSGEHIKTNYMRLLCIKQWTFPPEVPAPEVGSEYTSTETVECSCICGCTRQSFYMIPELSTRFGYAVDLFALLSDPSNEEEEYSDVLVADAVLESH